MVQTSTSSIVYLTKWLVNVGPLKLTNTTFFLRQWEIQMSLFLFRIGERLISQKQPFEEVTQAKTLTLVSLIEEYIQSFFVLHLFEHIVPSLCSEVVDIGPITNSVCFIFFFFFFKANLWQLQHHHPAHTRGLLLLIQLRLCFRAR